MSKYIHILFAGLVMAGCSSTAPSMDVSKWRNLSSTHANGRISWYAPDSVTETMFTEHVKHVSEQTSGNKTCGDGFWWKGYDINSWGYPAFIMEMSLGKYTQPHSNAPSLGVFRHEQMTLWAGATHVMEEVELGGNRWLRVSADGTDKLNACHRVQFQMPLTRDRFLNITAEYENEARKDLQWLASRMAVMSNVVASVRITTGQVGGSR